MNYLNLLDGTSAAIVLGGTVVATLLRCGWRNSLTALQGVFLTMRPAFDADRAKSELAMQLQDIHRDGLLRAEARHFGDSEFDDVTDTLMERRSLGPILKRHRAHQDKRMKQQRIVIATLNQAVEMAPVMGLAGTLIALSQLPVTGQAGAMMSTSIPAAIITTFYGLVAAHMLFAPLARFIARRADVEESERDRLIEWLTGELEREGVRHDPNRRREDRKPDAQVAA